MSDELDLSRRAFLTGGGVAMAAAAQGTGARIVAILTNPSDAVAAAPPARWAAKELEGALVASGCEVRTHAQPGEAAPGSLCILAAGPASPRAREALQAAGVAAPGAAESLVLASSKAGGRPVLLACGADARGLAYALLELADRVRHAGQPLAALEVPKADRGAARQPAPQHRPLLRERCGGQALVQRPFDCGSSTSRCWRRSGSTVSA